jgi:hypothetical protein
VEPEELDETNRNRFIGSRHDDPCMPRRPAASLIGCSTTAIRRFRRQRLTKCFAKVCVNIVDQSGRSPPTTGALERVLVRTEKVTPSASDVWGSGGRRFESGRPDSK